MKKKNVAIAVSILSLFLSGCANSHTSSVSSDNLSSSVISVSSSSSEDNSSNQNSSSSIVEQQLFTNIKGEFDLTNDEITSNKSNSLLIFNKQMNDGTFSARMTHNDSFSDNGIVFNYQEKEENISYYFLGINFMGELYISSINNEVSNVINKYDVEIEDEIRLSVYKDSKLNAYQIYVNNTYLDTIYADESSSNLFGCYAGGKETIYRDYVMIENQNLIDYEMESYNISNGEFVESKTGFLSTQSNSIMVHNSKTFEYGEFSANVKLNGTASDNGIIFGLNDGNLTSFWENRVSYYFLFVSLGGQFYLGKVSTGRWTLLAIKTIKTYDSRATYNIKVKKDENRMYCYLDGDLYFSYHDNSPTNGSKLGLRSGTRNISYSDIKIVPTKAPVENETKHLELLNGSFAEFNETYISKEENSIALMKDTSLYNGTLTTRFVPGNSRQNGIIFRVKKGDSLDKHEFYWLYFNPSTGVGFARYKDGVVTRELEKYLPAGSSYSNGYQVKIVMKDQDIYCYLDERLSFYYHEDVKLEGTGVGYKSDLEGSVYEKIEVSSTGEKETNDVLIFGHSYTEYWYTYKNDFNYYEDINNIGIGGSIASHWNREYNKEVIAYQPKLGIYWIGINDISINISPQEINNQVRSALFKIKEAIPEFEVILLGVNRCPARTNYYSQITQTNNLYKNLSQKNSWIKYVDVELLYCDASGTPLGMYFTDGLHLTHTAYTMAVAAINEQID